ncbi:uncharacterized protein LOC125145429 [Tachysurus ichikawai]
MAKESLQLNFPNITVALSCDLSAQTEHEYIGLPGGSVLLLCSCSDLNNKPHTFTWKAYIRGGLNDMLNDEHYRGRLQLFNHTSPGNLSLLISDLREKDGTDYRCSTEKGYRDMRINVKGGRRETSTRSGKTDRKPSSEQPPSKTTNSPPASSSTTLEQGTCGENGITEGRPDCKGKPTDQVSKRKMSYNRSVSTFRAFVVFVIHCSLNLILSLSVLNNTLTQPEQRVHQTEKTEYTNVITN